jgi:signal transduction histidine kinase
MAELRTPFVFAGSGHWFRLLRTENFRLAALYTGIFSLSVFLLGILVFYGIRTSLHEQVRSHIRTEMLQLMGDYQDDGLSELRHDVRERIEANNPSRLYYAITRQPKEGQEARQLFDKLPFGYHPGWHSYRQDEKALLVHTVALENGYFLNIAANLSPVMEMESAVRHSFAMAVISTLLIGAIGGLIMSRRLLARVDYLARTAEIIGQGDFTARLNVQGTGDEFDQLAVTINRMLERIETLVQEIRHVSTSIAHDLRTPLGQLRQRLEALADPPANEGVPSQKAVAEAIALLDQTLATFTALLRIAEVESGSRRAGFTRLNLSEIILHVGTSYQPVAEDNGQTLTCTVQEGMEITGDSSLLTQLCANLLENAIRHTPSGTYIQLTLRQEGHHPVLIVADNGPGVPAEAASALLKPFYRMDRSRHKAGSGLGLSLAHSIATLHQATLQLQENHPGLKVLIVFEKSALLQETIIA